MNFQQITQTLDGQWTTCSDNLISFDDILDVIACSDCDIYVGADSNPSRTPYVLAVSVAIVKKGLFAKYFYVRLKPWENEKKPAIRERLELEVVASCHVAMKIKERLPNRDINVHADVNPSIKTVSGKYSKQLKNMILSYGFSAEIKPDSWAASWLADRLAD